MRSPALLSFTAFGTLVASIPLLPAQERTRVISGVSRNDVTVREAFRPCVSSARASTVRVMRGTRQAALGAVVQSGEAESLVVTKASELGEDVEAAEVAVVLVDGRRLGATVVGVHVPTDLAMLRVGAGELATVTWAPDEELPPGRWLVTPGTGELPVAVGVASVRVPVTGSALALRARPPNSQQRYWGPLSEVRTGFSAVLPHDTVLRPEQCGGPLVDLEGRAVGINIARSDRVESLALPGALVRSLLEPLRSGRLAPGVLAAERRRLAADVEVARTRRALALADDTATRAEQDEQEAEARWKRLRARGDGDEATAARRDLAVAIARTDEAWRVLGDAEAAWKRALAQRAATAPGSPAARTGR